MDIRLKISQVRELDVDDPRGSRHHPRSRAAALRGAGGDGRGRPLRRHPRLRHRLRKDPMATIDVTKVEVFSSVFGYDQEE